MNKPPVNSLNLEFLDEIKTELIKLQNDKARGMILTSVCIAFFLLNSEYSNTSCNSFLIVNYN